MQGRNFALKKIYILLTRTGTLPAKVIHSITGGTFTHTSLSLTPSTDKLYSYARRKINNPFCAGLITENIHTEVFAQYPDCHCALYAITVSDEAYAHMHEKIKFFWANYKKAKYNFIGLIPLAFGLKIRRRLRLTCSQFVAIVLDSSKEIELPKDPYLMLPNDFMNINSIELVFDGKLKDCKVPRADYATV